MRELSPVRIGMLSFAHGHAYAYARALKQLPGVQITGIYDADRIRGADAAEQFGTPFFSQAETLLATGVDGVIVCAENTRHAPLVNLAAGYCHNILCEKPVATTLADAQAMIERCRETDTRLQIAFPVRFSPPILHLKSMLEQGEFGQVYCVKCTNHGMMPAGWFRDPELAGGGAVMDHTVHVADILRWLWQTEFTEVYAEIGSGLLHPDVPIDDTGLLSFRLANGIYGTLDTSWSRPASYPTWGDVKVEVVAARGTVTVNATNQQLQVSSNLWGMTKWVPWGSNMDSALMADFVEMIRTQRAPSISGEDGMAALAVALAAYESAAHQRPVTLAQMH